MLTRHSSRRTRLDHAVLNQRLDGAASYDRIAGYFRSRRLEGKEDIDFGCNLCDSTLFTVTINPDAANACLPQVVAQNGEKPRLAALANAEGMTEWQKDSEAARIPAGRLRNDQA
jgi:hypothetical protein